MENDPCPQLAKGIDLPQDEIVSRLSSLLDESEAFYSQPISQHAEPSSKAFLENASDTDEFPKTPGLFVSDPELVLPLADRRILTGLPPTCGDNLAAEGDDEEYHTDTPLSEGSLLQPPLKRVRFQDPEVIDEALQSSASEYMQIELDAFKDSGVFLDDPVYLWRDGQSSFVQQASNAEGSERPCGGENACPNIGLLRYGYDAGFDIPVFGLNSDSNADLPEPLSLQHSKPIGGHEFGSMPPSHARLSTPDPEDDPILPTSEGSREAAGAEVARKKTSQSATAVSVHSATRRHADAVSMAQSEDVTSLSASSTRQSLAQFLAFCGKAPLLSELPSEPGHTEATISHPLESETEIVLSIIRNTPPELIDQDTLCLHEDYEPPAATHRYMASMDLVHRRGLVRALRAYANVELIEREALDGPPPGVHLVLACDAAALFVPLERLPAHGPALADALAAHSWRFARLLVVFGCYPPAWDDTRRHDGLGGEERPVASAWSTPAVRAVQRLRREVQIAQGLGSMDARAEIKYAFADSVEDAAAFARAFGDAAEAQDCDEVRGAAWGAREWLTHDEHDVSARAVFSSPGAGPRTLVFVGEHH